MLRLVNDERCEKTKIEADGNTSSPSFVIIWFMKKSLLTAEVGSSTFSDSAKYLSRTSVNLLRVPSAPSAEYELDSSRIIFAGRTTFFFSSLHACSYPDCGAIAVKKPLVAASSKMVTLLFEKHEKPADVWPHLNWQPVFEVEEARLAYILQLRTYLRRIRIYFIGLL